MAQFDVYINGNSSTNAIFPYLLDIQNDLHNLLYSRLVVPLSINSKPIKHLTPQFTIEDKKVIMSTMDMASVSKSILNKKVCNLSEFRSEIIDAVDFLINGF